MGQVKLTKNELRDQQSRLNQLKRYLPTLQLKKALLQVEVNEARIEIAELNTVLEKNKSKVTSYAPLLAMHTSVKIEHYAAIKELHKHYENIAGIDVPVFDNVVFADLDYHLFDTPIWWESAINDLRNLSLAYARIVIAKEKKQALEKELRDVSIRVNLFEKILIPRCDKNIKMIKIFLGDQQLAAVSQAKVAKMKIAEHQALKAKSA